MGLFAESGWYHGARRPSSLGNVMGEGLCLIYSFLSFEYSLSAVKLRRFKGSTPPMSGPGLPPLSRCLVNRSERPE